MDRIPSPVLSIPRIWLVLVISAVTSVNIFAQSCPCAPAFSFVKAKTELNYAGFSEKVTDLNRAAYEAHTLNLKNQADTVLHPKNCAKICVEWLKWFKDGHLQVGPDLFTRARRPDSDFALSILDSQTLLFHLPSMNGNYKLIIDSILVQNDLLLMHYPYLIIDCRGNYGGALNTWNAFKRYLYTGPVMMDGVLYWASNDNAKALQSWIKPGMPKAAKKHYRMKAKAMKKSPGKFVGTMKAKREQLKVVLPNPKKVVLLMNSSCASSCEYFVLWAQQSRKVTIMGGNTAGVADYVATQSQSVPCHNWLFTYPIARSNRVPDGRGIDNIGISPTLTLDDKTPDWIEFARCWLKE